MANGFEGHRVDGIGGRSLCVGIEIVVEGANFDVAGRENQVALVDLADDVHGAKLMGFELERIDVDHDLAILAAERLGHGSTGDIRNLVANIELAKVVELRFIEAFAFQSDQTNRKAGSIELEHDGRKRSLRETAQLGHGEIGDGADV